MRVLGESKLRVRIGLACFVVAALLTACPKPTTSIPDSGAAGVPDSLPDTSAPTWPDGALLTVASTTATTATLTWPAAVDDVGVVTYRLFRDDVAAGDVAAPPFEVTSLLVGQHARYSVTALDAAGNTSLPLDAEAAAAPAFAAPDDGGASVIVNADGSVTVFPNPGESFPASAANSAGPFSVGDPFLKKFEWMPRSDAQSLINNANRNSMCGTR